MPRVTRKSLTTTESPEPTRRSSRAATQASSTSAKATPPPSRSRSRSVKKPVEIIAEGGDASNEEEKVEAQIEKKGARGRSQSKKKEPAVESPAPRGQKRKAAASASPKKGRGKTPKRGKVEAEDAENEGEEEEMATEPVPESETPVTEELVKEESKGRGRSRSQGKKTESPKPAATPSPSSRGRRGKTTLTSTPSPVKSSPRSRRGQKAEPEASLNEAIIETPKECSISSETSGAEPVKTTETADAKTESISEIVQPAEPVPLAESTPLPPAQTKSAAEPVSVPVVEPITPESETEPVVPAPVLENVSPVTSVPAQPSAGVSTTPPVPPVTAEADQTPSRGTKRKLDEAVESSAKRAHEELTNEAVPAKPVEVNTPVAPVTPSAGQAQPSQSTKSVVVQQATSQSSEAEAKSDITDDFEVISHSDVPPADSEEIQKILPAQPVTPQATPPKATPTQSSVPQATPPQADSTASTVSTNSDPVSEVTTSEARSSSQVNQASAGVVSSLSDTIQRSTNPSVEDISPVESSMDSNIGSYGDDKDPIPLQPSAANSNIISQSSLSSINRSQEPVPDSNINEAIPNQTNSYSSYQANSTDVVNQSEPVTSSNTTNGVSHVEKPKPQIKQIEPKSTPTPAFLSAYSKDIFNRKFLVNPAITQSVDPSRQFSVVSYNILADCHLRRGNYTHTAEDFLNQNYRHELLVRELRYLDADVVCLQEVNPEYFNAILNPALQSMGYTGYLHKRCQEYFNEGEATFYKTNRFTLVDQKGLNLKDLAEREIIAGGLNDDVQTAVRRYLDRADVVHIVRLQCKNTGKTITVGNIHVTWDKLQSPDVQSIQIASAIKELVSTAGNDTAPFIICGDFNSEVSSPGYQLARDGYLSDYNIQKLQSLENLETTDGSKSLVNHLWRAFQHTASNFRSAYNTVQGQEPAITSYVHSTHTLDYVFFNANSLDVNGTLQVVHEDVVRKTGGLPSADFPSDHLSLKAVFNLKN